MDHERWSCSAEFFALAFQALGHAPTSSDWPVFVFIQSILHAATAALVCVPSFAITRSRSAAFASGCYGDFIQCYLASGRLMTETLSVLFLVALPLSFRAAKDRAHMGVVGGLVCGIVLQLKPGMILSIVLSGLTCLSLTRSESHFFFALSLGAGITVMPWLIYTKLTTGKAAFLVQRWPVHNALIGWDQETAGLANQSTIGIRTRHAHSRRSHDRDSRLVDKPSAGSLKLTGEKIGLLFSTPWNDYRAKVFTMNAQAQEACHYGLLLAGLLVSFASSFLTETEERHRLPLFCARLRQSDSSSM